MLAFPLQEEHSGLKGRTTQNKLIVPNCAPKLASNNWYTSQMEQAGPHEPCCCVGPEKVLSTILL